MLFYRNRQISNDDFFDFDDSIKSSKISITPSKIDVIKNDWDNIKPAKKVNREVENDSWDSFSVNRKQNRNNRTKNMVPLVSENNEAFKKFGGAKSISSTQYFGDNQISVS